MLVSTTKRRVRQRAQELQRREERLRLVWVCCAAVTLATGFTTAVLWRGFAWIGHEHRSASNVYHLAAANQGHNLRRSMVYHDLTSKNSFTGYNNPNL